MNSPPQAVFVAQQVLTATIFDWQEQFAWCAAYGAFGAKAADPSEAPGD